MKFRVETFKNEIESAIHDYIVDFSRRGKQVYYISDWKRIFNLQLRLIHQFVVKNLTSPYVCVTYFITDTKHYRKQILYAKLMNQVLVTNEINDMVIFSWRVMLAFLKRCWFL